MNSIRKEEFARLIKVINKEAQVKKETVYAGRISGWGNSTKGVSYTYPRFDWSYYRNYTKVPSFSTTAFEFMKVEYSGGTFKSEYGIDESRANFIKSFVKHMPKDVYEIKGEEFEVRITNPYFKN